MDIVSKLAELRAKKEKAQTLLTKFQTQHEAQVEARNKEVQALMDNHGVTEAQAAETAEKHLEEANRLLEAASADLAKVEL